MNKQIVNEISDDIADEISSLHSIRLRFQKAMLEEVMSTVLLCKNTDGYECARNQILELVRGSLPNEVIEPIIAVNSAIGCDIDDDPVVYRWIYIEDKGEYRGYPASFKTGKRIEGADERSLKEIMDDYWNHKRVK